MASIPSSCDEVRGTSPSAWCLLFLHHFGTLTFTIPTKSRNEAKNTTVKQVCSRGWMSEMYRATYTTRTQCDTVSLCVQVSRVNTMLKRENTLLKHVTKNQIRFLMLHNYTYLMKFSGRTLTSLLCHLLLLATQYSCNPLQCLQYTQTQRHLSS